MKKEKIAGALLLCLWLVFILPILGQRMAVEKSYRGYETLVNYEDFKSQAFARGQSIQDYFTELAQAGATTVTVGEATINSLKVDPGSTIETSMNGINLRVKGSNEELAFIKEGLKCLKEEREIKDLGNGEIEIQGKENLRICGSGLPKRPGGKPKGHSQFKCQPDPNLYCWSPR